MGLGVAIGGSIGALTVFVVILTYPMVSDNLTEYTEAKSKINQINEAFAKTNFQIQSITAKKNLDFINFTLRNNGNEKLWDFENYNVLIKYDANIGGQKTKITEEFVYDPDFSFVGANVTQQPVADFKIQRGTVVIAEDAQNATLVEGVDFDICSGDCFVKQVSSRHSGMGRTSGGGDQNMDDFTTHISYDGGLTTAGDDINFTRNVEVNRDNRIAWEIWEYIGDIDDANEMKVLDTGVCVFGVSDLVCNGALNFDTATTFTDNCGLVPCTFSHTVGSGENRMLIVGIASENSPSISSVTYGTRSLTEIRTDDNSGNVLSSLWYIRESDIATRVGDSIIVTMNTNQDIVIGALSFTGVDQSFDPAAVGNNAGTTGTSVNPSIDIATTENNSILVDIVSTREGQMIPGSNQVERVDDTQGSQAGAMSTEFTGATTTYTMDWTNDDNSHPFAISTVALQPEITATPISGVTDDDDVVVFITGQGNTDDARNDVESCLVTSEWNSDNDVPMFQRGGVGNSGGADECYASYAVVEFTGSNWSVQRVEHVFTDASVLSTQPETITSVGDISRAFFHTQQRNGPDSNINGVCHTGTEVELVNPTTIEYRIPYQNTDQGWTSDVDMTAVTWVISNSETNSGESIIVNHYDPTAHGSGGSEEDNWLYQDDDGMTALTYATDTAVITGFSTQTDGCGTNYPRSFLLAQLRNSTAIDFWQSDSGEANEYTFQVTEFPRTDFQTVIQCDGDAGLDTLEWIVGNFTGDFLDPQILNPGETANICTKTTYPLHTTGDVEVIVSTNTGLTSKLTERIIP